MCLIQTMYITQAMSLIRIMYLICILYITQAMSLIQIMYLVCNIYHSGYVSHSDYVSRS
jgi:hypothetical protein